MLTLLTFLYVSRKTIFNVQREVGDYSVAADGGTIIAIIAMGLSLLYYVNHTALVSKSLKFSTSFVLYYLFAFCSILWAGNFGTITMKITEVLLSFMIVSVTLYKIKEKKRAFLYVILLSTLNAVIPYLIRMAAWGTLMVHTNTFTIGAIIGLLMSAGAVKHGIYSYKEMKYIIWANAYILVCGTSTASYICAIIGFMFLYGSTDKGLNIAKYGIISLMLYGVYYMYGDLVRDIIFQGRDEEMIVSGTGRDVIWEACINAFHEKPWFGHGFLVGERNLAGYGLGFNQLSAHNSFFSVLVNTGIAGVIVWFNFVIRWFWRSYACSSFDKYGVICFPAICASFVNSLSFPFIGSDWNVIAPAGYALIAFVFIYLPVTKKI